MIDRKNEELYEKNERIIVLEQENFKLKTEKQNLERNVHTMVLIL